MNSKHATKGILAAIFMAVLILDSHTAFINTKEGIELCTNVIIPSLLPFIILSKVIIENISGKAVPFMRKIGQICHIPDGHESILLIGCVGGYPVGAQCIRQAYEKGTLTRDDAQRMLAFCNNAGPAFIFGISSALFDAKLAPWAIWGIQITSAIAAGMLLKPSKNSTRKIIQAPPKSAPGLILQSIKAMAIICSWLILAKILIGYIELWFLYRLPLILRIPIVGILELSNGCVLLKQIESNEIKFIIINALLSFGGLCIWMQTASAVGDLSKQTFCIGKLIQTAISSVLSSVLSVFIFNDSFRTGQLFKLICCEILFILSAIMLCKKVVALRKKLLYNKEKINLGGDAYAFPKKTSSLL